MLDKDVFESLDEKFNTQVTSIPEKEEPEVLEDDFQQARLALKNMISKGQTAVDEIMHIARQSDNPRAFEVVGQLIKTVGDAAKDLLALQKTKKEISGAKNKEDIPPQIGTQNNILVTGTTNDILNMINQEIIEHEPE